MGSRSNYNQRRAVARNRVLALIARGEKVDENGLRFVRSFPKRHKCAGCGTGGHRRGSPRIGFGGSFLAEKA